MSKMNGYAFIRLLKRRFFQTKFDREQLFLMRMSIYSNYNDLGHEKSTLTHVGGLPKKRGINQNISNSRVAPNRLPFLKVSCNDLSDSFTR